MINYLLATQQSSHATEYSFRNGLIRLFKATFVKNFFQKKTSFSSLKSVHAENKRDELKKLKAYLVCEKEIFGCHIGRLIGCQKGFSDTNEKTNFITRLETARRIF